MPVTSAGCFSTGSPRRKVRAPEVLIAHMGGPFWAAKDDGGLVDPEGGVRPGCRGRTRRRAARVPRRAGRRPAAAARTPGSASFPYSSGKRITVFVADGAGFDPPLDGFGEFELEWPPRSGRMQSFPEVDRAEWMSLAAAHESAS